MEWPTLDAHPDKDAAHSRLQRGQMSDTQSDGAHVPKTAWRAAGPRAGDAGHGATPLSLYPRCLVLGAGGALWHAANLWDQTPGYGDLSYSGSPSSAQGPAPVSPLANDFLLQLRGVCFNRHPFLSPATAAAHHFTILPHHHPLHTVNQYTDFPPKFRVLITKRHCVSIRISSHIAR